VTLPSGSFTDGYLFVSLCELGAGLRVIGFVSRRNDFFSFGPQQLEHGLFIVALRRREQGFAGFLRRGESFCPLAGQKPAPQTSPSVNRRRAQHQRLTPPVTPFLFISSRIALPSSFNSLQIPWGTPNLRSSGAAATTVGTTAAVGATATAAMRTAEAGAAAG